MGLSLVMDLCLLRLRRPRLLRDVYWGVELFVMLEVAWLLGFDIALDRTGLGCNTSLHSYTINRSNRFLLLCFVTRCHRRHSIHLILTSLSIPEACFSSSTRNLV